MATIRRDKAYFGASIIKTKNGTGERVSITDLFRSRRTCCFLVAGRHLSVWCLFCLLCFGINACRQKDQQTEAKSSVITVTDAQGNQVTLQQPAQRIVTLVPHAAEIAISAGAAERLVGVSDRTELPEGMVVPTVGAYNQTNLENILAQRPDLVIAWAEGTEQAHIQKLKNAGIAVYVSAPVTLESITNEVTAIGVLAGTEKIATQNTQVFLAQLQRIKDQYDEKPPVRVFIQLGQNPIYTVSDNSFLGRLLQYCHAQNVFGSAPQPALKVNTEQVIKADPEVIVSLVFSAEQAQALNIWHKWPIQAQKNQHLYAIPEKQLGRPSLQILPELNLLCEKIDLARTTKDINQL